MSFASLSSNQTISYGNLQDAVDNGIYTLISSVPSPPNRDSSKSVISSTISGFNANYPPYAAKLNNELVVKGDIYVTGNVTLSPQYGMYFTGITATGFPSFTYPVNHLVAENYINEIPAQTITVYLNGTRYTTPLSITLYVGGTTIECKDITYNGYQAKTFTLPNNVYAPSPIFIAIDSGSCPTTPTPTSFTVDRISISTVSVSKNSGQYQIVAGGGRNFNNLIYYPTTQGYLYTSTNYGSSFYQKSPYSYWYKVATSGNGQYMLAIGSAIVYQSTNSLATINSISNLSIYSGKGAAISGTGQYQTIVGYGVLLTSSDYGASFTSLMSRSTTTFAIPSVGQYVTFTVQTGQPYTNGQTLKVLGTYNSGSNIERYFEGTVTSYNSSNGSLTIFCTYTNGSAGTFSYWLILTSGVNTLYSTAYTTAAMDSSGQHQIIAGTIDGSTQAPYAGQIYYSSDYGQTWSVASIPFTSSAQPSYFNISCSPDGTKMLAAVNLNTGTAALFKSTNYGVSWGVVRYDNNNYYLTDATNDTNISYATQSGNQYIHKITNLTTDTNLTTAPTQNSWQYVDMSNDGNYILAGFNAGLYGSNNGGSSFYTI